MLANPRRGWQHGDATRQTLPHSATSTVTFFHVAGRQLLLRHLCTFCIISKSNVSHNVVPFIFHHASLGLEYALVKAPPLDRWHLVYHECKWAPSSYTYIPLCVQPNWLLTRDFVVAPFHTMVDQPRPSPVSPTGSWEVTGPAPDALPCCAHFTSHETGSHWSDRFGVTNPPELN